MSTSTQQMSKGSLRRRLDAIWDGLLRTLYPWQRTYVTDRAQLKHLVSSRQIGKTHVIGFEVAIDSALGIRGPISGRRALIVSKDDDSSKEVLRECLNWIRVLQELGIVRIEGEATAGRINLDNGISIVSIPGGRPEAIRGPSGSVWCDEFAFHRDQAENLKNALGVATRGGMVRLISTPSSDSDTFWTIRKNENGQYANWSRHCVTIHDALKDGIVKPDGTALTVDELRRKMPDHDSFAQEYECSPMASKGSYLGDLIDPARLRYNPEFTSGSLYGGFDVARSATGDLAALCEVRRENDTWQAEPSVWADRGIDFEAMQTRVIREFGDRKWERMAIDATGLGMPVAEHIQKRLTMARVDSVTMTLQEKARMMTKMRSLLEMGQLALPDDPDLLLDLRSIKRIVGDNNIRYDAERNERGHADRAWALALAVRAAGSEPLKTLRQVNIRHRKRPREPLY